MDKKVVFDFKIKPKVKTGPKPIVVSKEQVVNIVSSRRRLTDTIVISPYEVLDSYPNCPNYDPYDVNDDYCFINARLLEPYMNKLNGTQRRLAWHFFYILQPNSNCVKFSVNHINAIHGTKVAPQNVYTHIKFLEDTGFCKRTNVQSLYVINHNLFFKGDLNKFAREYKQLYGDKTCDYTDRGYIIVDRNNIDDRLIKVTTSLQGV